MAEVVDLASSSEEEIVAISNQNTFQVWIALPPTPKPSVRNGPGRGYGRFGRFGGGRNRTYMDTPTRAKMKTFKSLVKEAMTECGFQMFPRHVPVEVHAWCFLKRPKEDFISRVRAEGRLKPESLQQANTVVPVKPDTDNLAKFILDAISEVVFADDSQIVELHMYKLRDNHGLCEGRVALKIKRAERSVEEMLPDF